MRAIVQNAYGGPGVLRLAEIEGPEIAADEVLVHVRAAGVDRGTWHLMTSQPYLMRILGFGFRRPKNPVPGRDVAGTVVEVGSAVSRFKPGDEVFGISRGSYAEYAAAREEKLDHKPANLSQRHGLTGGERRGARAAPWANTARTGPVGGSADHWLGASDGQNSARLIGMALGSRCSIRSSCERVWRSAAPAITAPTM